MTGRPDAPEPRPFPSGVDVLVLPGFPDRTFDLHEPGDAYPSTTIDVIKRLRAIGLAVDYAEPRENRLEVALKAHELWIPVLQVAQQVFINLAVWQFVKALELHASHRTEHERRPDAPAEPEDPSARPPILHVRMAVVRQGSLEARWVEIDGEPSDVERVLTQLQDELRE